MVPTSPQRLPSFALFAALATGLLLPGAASGAESRLGQLVRPTAQFIHLELDPRSDGYRGRTEIDLEIVAEVDAVRLHAREMSLARIRLAATDGEDRALASTVEGSVVALADGRPIPPGRYTLGIEFENDYDRRAVSLYKTILDGEPYLYTQFEMIEARGAFPCFDEPGFKLPFRLVVETPAEFDVVANEPVASEERWEGRRRLAFHATPPLPSYLVALAVGKFDFVPIPGTSVPARVVTPRGLGSRAGATVRETPAVLAELERWFGDRYPFRKLDLIAVPEFMFGGMENPGAITADAGILLSGDSLSPRSRSNLLFLLAHELAHIWFGDLVTMRWWDDFWLNESFAEWMGVKIVERVAPELELAAEFVGAVSFEMTADSWPSAIPVHNPGASESAVLQTGAVSYIKGQAVLAMVEGWIGANPFQVAIRRYLKAHAWDSATAADLWSALTEGTELPIAEVLRDFVEQPGVPLVRAESLPGGRVHLRQSRFQVAGTTLPPQSWRIPVRLRAGQGDRVVSIDVVLDAPERIVTFEGLDEIAWLLPNSGASGYYRWQLAGDAFARLAAVASKRLAPHEQRHLLDDALALLHAEQLDSSILLEVVRGACRSEEPLVALGVLDALQSVRLPLARGGVTRGWRRFLSSCLEPTFLRVGLDPRPGELPKVSDLRPALLERLGVQGADSRIRAWASSQLDAILSGRSAVDLSLQEVALRIVAEEGDLPLWERYWRRAESTTDPAERDRLLRGLMAFRRPVPFEATLALAAEDKLRPDEMFLPLFIPRAYPEWSPRLVEWMETAYPAYERRLSPDHRAILGVVGVGCDTALFDRAAAFLSATEPDNPALASRLGRAGDRTRACASLRAREESRAEAYLGRFQDD